MIFLISISCSRFVESTRDNFEEKNRLQTAYAALVPQEFQPPVVQTSDSAIYHYSVEKYQGNQLRYSLDSDLSSE